MGRPDHQPEVATDSLQAASIFSHRPVTGLPAIADGGRAIIANAFLLLLQKSALQTSAKKDKGKEKRSDERPNYVTI